MDEIIVIILFLIWYIGALILSENTSNNNKINTEWLFLISMIFSPIIGLFVYLVDKRK